MGWAKLGDEVGRQILHKLFNRPHTLKAHLTGDWKFYYHRVGRYWLKAYTFLPTYLKADGRPGRSSTLCELTAENADIGKVLVGVINSSLFFWYWTLYSDDFDLMVNEIENFPFTFDAGYHFIYRKIGQAVDALMQDYADKSVLKRGVYPTGTITWQEFYPRQSKAIIDQIDDLLGALYGLTREEVTYIKQYDSEFRSDE